MLNDLEQRIKGLSDEELWRMVHLDYKNYRKEAIDLAAAELLRRGLYIDKPSQLPEGILVNDSPICIDLVTYTYQDATCEGSLIITRGVIYFYPLSKVEAQQRKIEKALAPSPLLSLSYSLFQGVQRIKRNSKMSDVVNISPRMVKKGLFREDYSSQTIQERFDAHCSELVRLAAETPSPTYPSFIVRLASKKIQNISFTDGLLIIEVGPNRHHFKIGLGYIDVVIEALRCGNFIVSYGT
jgi:hypothetical protein